MDKWLIPRLEQGKFNIILGHLVSENTEMLKKRIKIDQVAQEPPSGQFHWNNLEQPGTILNIRAAMSNNSSNKEYTYHNIDFRERKFISA